MLTVDDCVEIYYALSDEALINSIGADGALLADGTFKPTKENWDDIRGAVESKLESVQSGFYGRDRETREWEQHLEEILTAIQDEQEGWGR